MKYNWKIKNMEDVWAAFPAFKEEYKTLPFYYKVAEFKKEELNEFLDDAKFYNEKITKEKRKQFEEIAEVRAVYRFCWGWEQIMYNMTAHRKPAKNCVFMIRAMLKTKKDPWACDSETVTDYMNKKSKRNPGWGDCTDAEALKDIDYND
jgi:hypothetical protein